MNGRILLLGKNGQVGYALEQLLAEITDVVALDSAQLDIAAPEGIRAAVRHIRPRLIINAAAYTAVDRAEEDIERAMAINAAAPAILAEEAKRLGAALIHYSTDYVFDGSKSSPYTESDTPHPLNAYGRSKLAGDQAVLEADIASLILRTSWVYGRRGHNFLLTMQRLLRERAEINVVDDQIGSPTWCNVIAAATVHIIERGGDDSTEFIGSHSGLYNMSCTGQTSWLGFATAIRSRMREADERLARLQGISTGAYPTPAARPAYSVLDNSHLRAVFGVGLPDWLTSLDAAMGVDRPDVAKTILVAHNVAGVSGAGL